MFYRASNSIDVAVTHRWGEQSIPKPHSIDQYALTAFRILRRSYSIQTVRACLLDRLSMLTVHERGALLVLASALKSAPL
jgi:hypothetical protein